MSHTVRGVKRSGDDRALTQDPRRLRRRRIEAGLSIRALAKKAGLGMGTICDLENGRQSAHPATLAALAKALERDIPDLMADEPSGNAA